MAVHIVIVLFLGFQMASWQQPKDVLLHNIDFTCVTVDDLKAGMKERLHQLNEHVNGILSMEVEDTQLKREVFYGALIEIDCAMKKFEALEQKFAEMN